MSELDLLFEAARADVPRAGAKAKAWAGVAKATGLAPAAAPTPTAAPAAAAAKSGALGGATAGLASVVAIGLAALGITASVAQPSPLAAPSPTAPRAAKAIATVVVGLGRAEDDPRAPATRLRAPPLPSASASTAVVEQAGERRATPARVDDGDSLSKEAQLLAEARGALRRGDAARALAAVRSARALPARALEPEALSLEARALRALDRGAEAAAKDAELRGAYPEHALSR